MESWARNAERGERVLRASGPVWGDSVNLARSPTMSAFFSTGHASQALVTGKVTRGRTPKRYAAADILRKLHEAAVLLRDGPVLGTDDALT